jgi:hypothetical protein
MPVWFIWFPFCSIVYVFKAYFQHGSQVSGSCFFMPCAPQSLGDSDQLYPLMFGVLSFIGFDVLPVAYKIIKARFKHWQGKKIWIRKTADRFKQHELKNMSTPGLARRNTPGTVV